jgi:hypothetical protein
VAAWGGLLALFGRSSSGTSSDGAMSNMSTSSMPAAGSEFSSVDQLSISSIPVSSANRDEDGDQGVVSRQPAVQPLPAASQGAASADSPSRRAARQRKPTEWRVLQATECEQTGTQPFVTVLPWPWYQAS